MALILGPLSLQKPNTAPFWGLIFPPKSPTRHRFGDHFPPKPNTAPFWGPLFPQKPTRRRFGDQVSHQISHVGPAFFLSFLVSFLFWFGLSGLMGLGFISTSDINVCIMGYYMTMGLSFFFAILDVNVCIMSYYMIMGLSFFFAISDVSICIMGYYMTMGLGFFFLQSQMLIYVLWVII